MLYQKCSDSKGSSKMLGLVPREQQQSASVNQSALLGFIAGTALGAAGERPWMQGSPLESLTSQFPHSSPRLLAGDGHVFPSQTPQFPMAAVRGITATPRSLGVEDGKATGFRGYSRNCQPLFLPAAALPGGWDGGSPGFSSGHRAGAASSP